MRGDPRVTLASLAMMAGLATAAPVSASAQPAPPYPAVPAPQYEVVPPPRGPAYLWEPGHWFWNGAAYAWAPGHYIVRRAHYGQFVPGHWAMRPGGWVWVQAHWR